MKSFLPKQHGPPTFPINAALSTLGLYLFENMNFIVNEKINK